MPIDVKTFQLFIFNGCEAGRDTITLDTEAGLETGLEARGYSCEERGKMETFTDVYILNRFGVTPGVALVRMSMDW